MVCKARVSERVNAGVSDRIPAGAHDADQVMRVRCFLFGCCGCIAFVALTGLGGVWSIVVCLFFVVSVVGILSANCTTDLMHRYPHNAGATIGVTGVLCFVGRYLVLRWHGRPVKAGA